MATGIIKRTGNARSRALTQTNDSTKDMRNVGMVRGFVRKIIRRLRGQPEPVSIRDYFSVGRGTYGEPLVLHWGEPSTLRLGSFCSIAGGVTIFLGGNHRTDWITMFPFMDFRDSAKGVAGHPQTKGDVVIGNDVWIATCATILSGISIGNGAVVGAYSVVTKDVPPYTIVGGNPARPLRKRFTDEQIALLEEIAWWNWSDAKLDLAMPILLSANISELAAFAARHSAMA